MHPRRGVLPRLAGAWQRLTQPASSLGEPHRHRARLLAALLLVLLPVGPLADALRLLLDPEYHPLADPGWPVMVGALGALSLLYALSRTARYVLAAWLTILLVMSGTWAAVLVSRTSPSVDVRAVLVFLTLGVLLSSLLLSVRATLLLALASLGSFLLLPILAPEITPRSLVVPLLVSGSLASLLVIAAALRQRDQAQLENATAQLRESEASFRLLFRDNPHPMWVYHRATLRFLEVNDAAVARYGYSRAEFQQMRIPDIRPPEEVPHLLANLQASRLELERTDGWRHQRKDGRIIDVEITSHTLDFAGQPAVLVVAFDVTERKQLEEQLRQAQKMEAIGQLAGGVAHDFNNLLTVIMGYGALVEPRLPTNSPEREAVQQILRASESAAALTRQLLAFSRRQIIAPQEIDLNDVVEQLGKMLRRVLGEDIALTVTLAPHLGRVRADPGQIEQVLLNLATNARDAMPQGGRLTLETANVELDAAYTRQHAEARPGPHVLLAVSDTGMGMDVATQARIFEPFFTTKEVGKGTGLGLAAVYGIVKQSEGAIYVYSEPGQGTTFKIYLPRLATVSPWLPPHPAPGELPRGTETILVIEDDQSVRLFARAVLEGCGYTILEAAEGEPALAVAAEYTRPIDLLLTDVVMPGVGGRQVAERLQARHPSVKVLYMSGYTDDAVVRHGVVEAGVPFLQKPFTPRALAQKVRTVLDTRAL